MATINATTSQGGYLDHVRAVSLYNWSDLIDPGFNATTAWVDNTFMYTRAKYQSGRSGTWTCSRGYMVFNTSAITGTLTSLNIWFYVDTVLDINYTPLAILQLTTSPTLSTALTTSDWQYTTGLAVTTDFGVVNDDWNQLVLNNEAVSVPETENEMTLQLRDFYYDYDYGTNLTDPTADGYIIYRNNYSGYIPYLEYTMVTGYGQTVNGIIAANMANVDGIAKSSISKVLGV